MEIDLDGFDGFFDQSLWHYKKGNEIKFLINPSLSIELLDHDFLITEVIEDSNNTDWARVRITEVLKLSSIFINKPIKHENEYRILIREYVKSWNHTREMKQKMKNYRYRPFHNHFLTFKELNKVLQNNEIKIERSGNGRSRIYAKTIDRKSVRVLSVYDNDPESCLIYDIDDSELYKSEIQQMRNRNQCIDENEFWNKIIVN